MKARLEDDQNTFPMACHPLDVELPDLDMTVVQGSRITCKCLGRGERCTALVNCFGAPKTEARCRDVQGLSDTDSVLKEVAPSQSFDLIFL